MDYSFRGQRTIEVVINDKVCDVTYNFWGYHDDGVMYYPDGSGQPPSDEYEYTIDWVLDEDDNEVEYDDKVVEEAIEDDLNEIDFIDYEGH